ncbi:MAG: hypothetical protein FWF46_07090 [Oscillospiraceae bacterium]|nr:hypothetical protein [Oscillospiraceae bacterium]
MVLKIIGTILALVGVIWVYDARKITKKYFGFGDQNEGSLGLKMIGFIISIVGAIIFYIGW